MCGGLAAGEEAGEAGHLPDLVILLGGGFADIELDIGADVEDDDAQRPDLLLDLFEQGDDLILLACIAAEGVSGAAGGADLFDEGGELFGVAARDADLHAFAGEALGERGAQAVAGPHDEGGVGGGEGIHGAMSPCI